MEKTFTDRVAKSGLLSAVSSGLNSLPHVNGTKLIKRSSMGFLATSTLRSGINKGRSDGLKSGLVEFSQVVGKNVLLWEAGALGFNAGSRLHPAVGVVTGAGLATITDYIISA